MRIAMKIELGGGQFTNLLFTETIKTFVIGNKEARAAAPELRTID